MAGDFYRLGIGKASMKENGTDDFGTRMLGFRSPMRPELRELIRRSVEHEKALPEAERKARREAQIKSFVYGNCSIDNPAVTREIVEQAVEESKDD